MKKIYIKTLHARELVMLYNNYASRVLNQNNNIYTNILRYNEAKSRFQVCSLVFTPNFP